LLFCTILQEDNRIIAQLIIVVFPSLIYVFWLLLWYLQALLSWFLVYFRPMYCISFDLRHVNMCFLSVHISHAIPGYYFTWSMRVNSKQNNYIFCKFYHIFLIKRCTIWLFILFHLQVSLVEQELLTPFRGTWLHPRFLVGFVLLYL
jgi:hypothetical protein